MWEATFSVELELDHVVKSSEKKAVLGEMASSIGLGPRHIKRETEKAKSFEIGKVKGHLHFYRNPSISLHIEDELLIGSANKAANTLLSIISTRFGKSVESIDVSLDYGTNAAKGANPVRVFIDSPALSRLNEKLKTGFSAVGLVLQTKMENWDIIVLLARSSSNKPFEAHIFSHRELSGGMQWDLFAKQAETSIKLMKDLTRALPEASG